MTPLLSASSRLCQGIYTAQADRWSTSALEERGRGLSHATPSLNHCHPERSAKERSDEARVEGPRVPQHHHDYVREFTPHKLIYGPPRRRKREAAASTKPRPSFNHCHPERSAKERSDGARVEGPRFPQHHHDYVREFTPLHTNIINAHHEPMPMSRMLRCRFSLHVLSIFQSALNVSRCFSTLARGLRIEPLSSRSCS
jgi:hypothetical protein